MPATSTLPPDSDLPELEILLGDGAVGVLRAGLPRGAEIGAVVPRQLLYRPGRALTLRLGARVRWNGGPARRETFVAAAGDDIPAGAAVLESDGARVAVWRLPDDPVLPGLRPALDRGAVQRLLGDLGVPAADPELAFVTYRPGRRAVVRAAAAGAVVYLKVVPPDRARALHDTHRRLAATMPVPRSHGFSRRHGIVVLGGLPGRTLRSALRDGHGHQPSASALVALLDDLPDRPGETARPGWGHRRHGRLIAAVLPRLRDRVARLVEGLDAAEAVRGEDLVPVHGDFHEAQVLVDDGSIRGLLDLDDVGRGHRTDDLATLLGHLTTLALSSSEPAAIDAYRRRLCVDLERRTDPGALRAATAAVVLGLATGPLRVLQDGWAAATRLRVAYAQRWLEAAQDPDGPCP